MLLEKHPKNIVDCESWFRECPPKEGKKQWVEGRSAMELAKYITQAFPAVPTEIESAIEKIAHSNARFKWDAEYKTALPGKGEGRNHDAILFNNDILVTIEAKADETLGGLVKEEIKKASVNKLYRITKLLEHLFPGNFRNYHDLRYQLITASVGTILEAKKKNVDTAVLLVIVFETNGKVKEENLAINRTDVAKFLEAANAYEENGLTVIPNNTDVKLYFKEIVI